jgi:hypothetical protein
MENPYQHIHWATTERLADMVEEIARRHVDEDKETLLEAATRLRNIANAPKTFNHEQFSID